MQIKLKVNYIKEKSPGDEVVPFLENNIKWYVDDAQPDLLSAWISENLEF